MLLATYEQDGNHYGLVDDSDLEFMDYHDPTFGVVFSTTGQRSYCQSDITCTHCPFTNTPDHSTNCQAPITHRPIRYLQLFGITPDSHPEYFL